MCIIHHVSYFSVLLYTYSSVSFSIVFRQLIDEWTFDVFALSDVSAGSPLRYLGIDLLNRYGVIHKFKVYHSNLTITLCIRPLLEL
jgi:hypothetical protein